jgi:hypothetical protein
LAISSLLDLAVGVSRWQMTRRRSDESARCNPQLQGDAWIGAVCPLAGFCRHGDSWSARMCLRSAGWWPIIVFMAEGMVAVPPCAACGAPSARLEVVAPGELPRTGNGGRTIRGIRFAGARIRLGGGCCSRGWRPGTAVIRSRRRRRIGWPRRSACRTATRGFIRPGCTTIPGSARHAACRTARGTGRSAGRVTGTARRVTGRAWTRTGHRKTPARDRLKAVTRCVCW